MSRASSARDLTFVLTCAAALDSARAVTFVAIGNRDHRLWTRQRLSHASCVNELFVITLLSPVSHSRRGSVSWDSTNRAGVTYDGASQLSWEIIRDRTVRFVARFVKLIHSCENFLRDIVDVIASEILFVTIILLFSLKAVFSFLFAWQKSIASHGWQVYICRSSVRIKLIKIESRCSAHQHTCLVINLLDFIYIRRYKKYFILFLQSLSFHEHMYTFIAKRNTSLRIASQ